MSVEFKQDRPRSWFLVIVFSLGLIAAVPNLILAYVIGSWNSVPAHRAVEDGQALPKYDLADLALNYLPMAIVILVAFFSIVVFSNGRKELSAILGLLQLLALIYIGAHIFVVL